MAQLGLLASAISRRPVRVVAGEAGAAPWTDGEVIYLDARRCKRAQIRALSVQASLLSAGSLDRDLARRLTRSETLARRYLATEGHRALGTVAEVLPPSVARLARAELAACSDSPAASLEIARGGRALPEPPDSFGTIRARHLLAALRAAARAQPPSARRAQAQRAQAQLADGASADGDAKDAFASPVGGGGPIGRWLSKLLVAVRKLGGGGAVGADAPTHWTGSARPGQGRSLSSLTAADPAAGASAADVVLAGDAGVFRYPEWDVHAGRYRSDWCSVLELPAEPGASSPRDVSLGRADRSSLRRALARLGVGIDRQHRQAQGDDIDIDAAIEAHVELLAGSAPDEDVFIDSVRTRRDLGVLLLLDVSGSAAEPAVTTAAGAGGEQTVHARQRDAAAALTLALHELGDRVALYAYHSRGRAAVQLSAVKRFSEAPNGRVLRRLDALKPGGYSRLGAAIRHGTAVLRERAGTPRRLLVVLSDGLAYDHGYEPVYGAADAHRALEEARAQGVGCLCLSVGSATDAEVLRRVFGASAHATLADPAQLSRVVGPLFRAAIRAADVRRRVSGEER